MKIFIKYFALCALTVGASALTACEAQSRKPSMEMLWAGFGWNGGSYFDSLDTDTAVARPARTPGGDPLYRQGAPVYCLAIKKAGSDFDMSQALETGPHVGVCQLSEAATGRSDVMTATVWRDPQTNLWK